MQFIMSIRISVVALFLGACCISTVRGVGADHPPVTPAVTNAPGQTALQRIHNRADRVHGYWVNSEDVFFYAGTTTALSDFIASCSKLEDTQVEITLNVGPKKARSPWDDEDRNIVTNWSLYTAPYDVRLLAEIDGTKTTTETLKKQIQESPATARIDIWLGGPIVTREIQIPPNIPLRASTNVMLPEDAKDFVSLHEAARKRLIQPD